MCRLSKVPPPWLVLLSRKRYVFSNNQGWFQPTSPTSVTDSTGESKLGPRKPKLDAFCHVFIKSRYKDLKRSLKRSTAKDPIILSWILIYQMHMSNTNVKYLDDTQDFTQQLNQLLELITSRSELLIINNPFL